VIEDGKALQRALKRLFEPEGFTVAIASDGPGGLELFKAGAPDIVLLDLGLPGKKWPRGVPRDSKDSATVRF